MDKNAKLCNFSDATRFYADNPEKVHQQSFCIIFIDRIRRMTEGNVFILSTTGEKGST